jgi:DNA modification methylase
MTTTLWEYPSQHYDQWIDPDSGEVRRSSIRREERAPLAMQGDKEYVGATPSWIIWQLLQRYTRPGDTVLDPMCGSGTTLDWIGASRRSSSSASSSFAAAAVCRI